MPKLQRIKRSEENFVFSVNIPIELIRELEWVKGSKLNMEVNENNFLVISKDNGRNK